MMPRLVGGELHLLGNSGVKEYVERVRPYVRHKHTKVSSEALRALVQLEAPDAITYIRLFIKSRIPEMKKQAIKLCGDYRIREMVPHLIDILKTRDIFGTELQFKSLSITALGQIGDPRALGTLEKLLSLKPKIYKRLYDEIKLDIVKSFVGYSFDKVKPLLESVAASRSEEAKAAAKKLLSGELR